MSDLPRELADAPPESRFDKYIRSRKLGAGGMGEVWKAWDTGLGRWVALKFLKGAATFGTPATPGGDDDEIARFQREAQLAGKLSHPNIAAIYDVGVAQDRHYISMQFVEGQTLKSLPRGDRRLLARLARDAALAVQSAHEQGVIHRDLKPENLMVTPAGHLYVMDFGLARSVEGHQSISGMVLGTPSYMPPEQARGERADERADVYALGATLYELLADRPPFKGGSVFEILARVQDEEAKPLRRLDPAIDSDLETIVLKCLEKDRDRRYPTAAALAADLTRWLEGDAISARPASIIYRLRKRLSRRKPLVAAVAVALLALVAGGGYGLMLSLRTHTRETRVYPLVERARELVRSADAMLTRPQPSQESWAAKLAEAETLCRDALAIHARYAPAHLVLGLVEMQRGEFDRAAASFDAALLADPGYEQARLERAKGNSERIFRIEHQTAARDAVDRAEERRLFALVQEDLSRVSADRLAPEERIVVDLLGFMVKDDLDGLRARLAAASAAGEADERAWRVRGEMEHRRRHFGKAVECFERVVDLRRGDVRGLTRLSHMLHDADRLEESAAVASRAIAMRPDAEAHVLRGRASFVRGDLAAAIADYDRAIQLRSGYAEAHMHRAQARQGDDAMADFDRAIALRSGFHEAYAGRGYAKQVRGDATGAMTDCDSAIELSGGSASAFYHRARVRLLQGDAAGATVDFDKAIAVDGNYADAHVARGFARQERGDLDGALADYTRAIAIKKTLVEAWSNRAAVKSARGDPAGAIADADRAIELNPSYTDAYVNRASAKLKGGNITGAVEDADKALALEGGHSGAFDVRGSAKRALGDPRGAVADFDRAVELARKPFESLYNRGNAKQDLGDWAGAIADYDRAIGIKADSAPVFNNRGNARKANGDVVGAIADFDRAIALDGSHAESHYNRGNAKQALGDFTGAVADYDRAIALRRDYPEPWCNRGIVKDARGDPRGAIADYDRAIELRPDYVRAIVNRGFSRMACRQEREALADFELAIRLRKDFAPAWHGRGVWRKDHRDPAGAIADFDRAIELKSDFAEAFLDRGQAKLAAGDAPGAVADYDRVIAMKKDWPEPWYNRALARKSGGDTAGAIADAEKALTLAPAGWPHRKRVEQTIKAWRD